ncbi:glutamate 5-kinase [Rothia sp. ZJ932]|uniref:glutamate 5-kinase n=1 Tax=Rothia sp. ZJ932 TaxID=2810516 RepID=UPI001966D237|nr:glutamate 5-kinase [Rothia sp. ZJ932]QRZ62577.1 glutamate 5-kinase [Rothia sp. ZJ932]
MEREHMPRAQRIVVKVGSSSLTSVENSLDELAIATISDVLAKLKRSNPHVELVFVSSGAIAAGLAPLGLKRRPKDLATQQAAASVGQSLLMTRYTDIFARYGVTVSQVLLTVEDLIAQDRYTNVHRQLERLLDLGVMPIVNENDAVATAELKFGDNDRIAALVAHTVKADALVLLSDVDALYDKHPDEGGVRVHTVSSPDALEGLSIGAAGSAVGSGGMATKVMAASLAAASGIPALVTSASKAREALAGQDVGTWFYATGTRRSTRMLWLEHLADARGAIMLDAGAVAAVKRRNSLLAAGITGVEGAFEATEPVNLIDMQGTVIARGLAAYDAASMRSMVGLHSREIIDQLGDEFDGTVVHADNIALVTS